MTCPQAERVAGQIWGQATQPSNMPTSFHKGTITRHAKQMSIVRDRGRASIYFWPKIFWHGKRQGELAFLDLGGAPIVARHPNALRGKLGDADLQPVAVGKTKLKWICEESQPDFIKCFLRGEPIHLCRSCASQKIDDYETVALECHPAKQLTVAAASMLDPLRRINHERKANSAVTAITLWVTLILNSRLATEVVPAVGTTTGRQFAPAPEQP